MKKAVSLVSLGMSYLLAPGTGLASPLSDLAATVEPGEFVELEVDGPVSTCDAMVPPDPQPMSSALGNILEFTDEALWDPVGRSIYIMGERRPYRQPEDTQFARYSESDNTWEVLPEPPFYPGFHAYDHAAIDPADRTLYRARAGTPREVWVMNLDSRSWARLPDVPVSGAQQVIVMDYFPDIGRLAYFNNYINSNESTTNYATYSSVTGEWETREVDAPFGIQSAFSEYNADRGFMFFGGGFYLTMGGTVPDPTPDINESTRLYMMDASETVTRLADAPIRLGQSGDGPIQTIDPNTGRLVVFPGSHEGIECPDPNPIYEYDPDGDTWRQTGMQDLADRWCTMNSAAVPLYEYGVIFIVTVRSSTNCRVLLYRHSPGTGPGLDDPPTGTTGTGTDTDTGSPGAGTAEDTGAADAGAAEDTGAADAGAAENTGAAGTGAAENTGAAGTGAAEGAQGTETTGGCQCGQVSVSRGQNPVWMFLAMLTGVMFVRRRSREDDAHAAPPWPSVDEQPPRVSS